MIYVEILWLTHYKFFLKDLFLTFCTRTMIHSHTKVIWEAQFLSSFRLSCSKERGFCEIRCCSERELVLLAVCHSQRALHYIYQLPHLFFFSSLSALAWFGILSMNKTHLLLPIFSPQDGISFWPRTQDSQKRKGAQNIPQQCCSCRMSVLPTDSTTKIVLPHPFLYLYVLFFCTELAQELFQDLLFYLLKAAWMVLELIPAFGKTSRPFATKWAFIICKSCWDHMERGMSPWSLASRHEQPKPACPALAPRQLEWEHKRPVSPLWGCCPHVSGAQNKQNLGVTVQVNKQANPSCTRALFQLSHIGDKAPCWIKYQAGVIIWGLFSEIRSPRGTVSDPPLSLSAYGRW